MVAHKERIMSMKTEVISITRDSELCSRSSPWSVTGDLEDLSALCALALDSLICTFLRPLQKMWLSKWLLAANLKMVIIEDDFEKELF